MNLKDVKNISIKKRKKIHMNLRITMITILSIIVILSAYNAYAAFQQPTTSEKIVDTCIYNHIGKFSYIVYLKDNIVYNTSILYPGQGIIFKKITDHINASFTYRFSCNRPATVQGSYRLLAEIETDLWSKQYTLISKKSFSSNDQGDVFTIDFPIDYSHYEGIVNRINDETGVTASNPKLILTCDIDITTRTTNGSIYDSFTPSLSVPLLKNPIAIGGDLSPSQSGSLKGIETVFNQEVVEQQNTWSLTSIIFFIILVLFFAFTESRFVPLSKAEKTVGKLQKKYGEWIAEVEKPPSMKGAKTIPMKSMEDLIKISEELGKPVIHYKSPEASEATHIFSVLDEGIHYEYVLKQSEKDIKTTRCPKCKTKVTYEDYSGESIYVTCPNCGNKGVIKPKLTSISNPFKKLIGK